MGVRVKVKGEEKLGENVCRWRHGMLSGCTLNAHVSEEPDAASVSTPENGKKPTVRNLLAAPSTAHVLHPVEPP